MTTLHVADFGPLGTADDSATINAALAHAYWLADPAMTEVLVPAGLYWLQGPLLLGSWTHLRCVGARFAWSAYSPTSMLRCRNTAPVFGYDGEHDFELTGGIFDGNRFAIGDGTNLISIVHARHFTLRQFHCTEAFDHHLVEINACEQWVVEDFRLSNSSGNSEAFQVDGMFNQAVYAEFGAWDNTPCRDFTIRRGVIWGVRDGIGSHTVELPHLRGRIEDVQVVCSGSALKLNGWDEVTLAGVLDLTAPAPIGWTRGRQMAAAFTTPPFAAPLPEPLPPLPPPPAPEPDPEPEPLPPPTGASAMHVEMYGNDTTWPNQPVGLTEINVAFRQMAWLAPYTQMRVGVYLKNPGAAASEVTLEWSADRGATWTSFAAWVSLAASGNAESVWVVVPEAARGDVMLRAVGRNGNGVTDPLFSRIYGTFR